MKTIKYSILLLLALGLASCEEYLEVKPDKSLAIPTDRLDNLLRLLDYTSGMNLAYPMAGEVASDNLFIRPADWNAVPDLTVKNTYVWDRDVFNDNARNDWSSSYQVVFYANLVLEGTGKVRPGAREQQEWNMIKGSALFFRAHAFYHLLQEFAKPYDESTAAQDPGIVLRLSSDLNERSVRASVRDSYERVLQDLKEAAGLLPEAPAFKTRPSKPAALALLARTYLLMERYAEALSYADQALGLQSRLLDFNQLNPGVANPVPRFHEEVIFHSTTLTFSGTYYPVGKVNPALYALYAPDDLRRTVFYRERGPGDIEYRGSASASTANFNGIATDELYLIRAECLARLGKWEEAMDALNTLLEKRWKAGTFTPLEAADAPQALALILQERRKELPFRGLRWSDLRRLNRDSRFAVTLTRDMEGTVLTLPPGDPRYVFPIPQKVIESSGIAQN